MVTVMQAVHCVSWEPLSGQDMRLVWRRRSMRNHKEVSTSLFRKSLCVRMHISNLINNPTLAEAPAAHKRPPCDSMIDRLMGSPIPVPLSLLVSQVQWLRPEQAAEIE